MSSAPNDRRTIGDGQLQAILEKHGLRGRTLEAIDTIGFVNDVWTVGGDLVLRVPRPGPSLWETWNERVAAPAAHRAGVRTPRLVVFDGDLDIVDVPFTIYERISGRALSQASHRTPSDLRSLYVTVGRELAALHHGAGDSHEIRSADLACGVRGPPEAGLAAIEQLRDDGRLSDHSSRWVLDRLERFAPAVRAAASLRRFLHHDLSPDNALADGHDLTGIIDWGEATYGDPAFDLAHLPPRTLPFVVEGYRQIAPFDLDESAHHRILWDQLDITRWRLNPRLAHEWRRSRLARMTELFAAAVEWPSEWRALLA